MMNKLNLDKSNKNQSNQGGPKLLNILVVEDDEAHAQIIQRTLSKCRVGNRVDRVCDGTEALEFLKNTDKYQNAQRPDLILLDLNMPKKDGHEVLMELKEDPELRTIPVVIMSTSDAEIDRLRAYQNHANSYLVKPLDTESFYSMIEALNMYWGVINRPAVGPKG